MATVRFLKEAQEDYERLDGSQKKWVAAAVHRLEERGGEIGEALGKSASADLRGYKKLKNNQNGLRIIFRENTSGQLEIIEIIVIGKREDFEVYRTAGKRIAEIQDQFEALAKEIHRKKYEE
jgi:mRNA interferase RelE/StbE